MSNPRPHLSASLEKKATPLSFPMASPKKHQNTADHAAVSVELMQVLLDLKIIPDIGYIIMAYALPSSLRKATFNPQNPNQFFISRVAYTCFNRNFSDLAEADQHCVWGRPEELDNILMKAKKKSTKKQNLLAHILTHSIDGEDHRGPGFIPPGTLLQRALYAGDVLNEDAETKITMVDMLKDYVIKNCGEEEFKRQLKQSQEVIREESKMKISIEKDDLLALNEVWDVLKNASEPLQNNAELKTALDKYENQLKKPGNDRILEEIEKLSARDSSGFTKSKNNFVRNNIMGKAQFWRLPVCDLQIYFSGLVLSIHRPTGKISAIRIDVRKELGVLSTGNTPFSLGSNCHLDIIGARPRCVYTSSGEAGRLFYLDKFMQIKNIALTKIMQKLDNPSNENSIGWKIR